MQRMIDRKKYEMKNQRKPNESNEVYEEYR